jgi:tetratricopeptide (TPR) repeat protein
MALVLQTSSLNHLLKGDLKRAIEEGESAIKMATLPLAHYYLSQAYRSDQKFAPAVTHLSRYIELSKAEVSADELKKSREELQMLIRMRDSNRQNK